MSELMTENESPNIVEENQMTVKIPNEQRSTEQTGSSGGEEVFVEDAEAEAARREQALRHQEQLYIEQIKHWQCKSLEQERLCNYLQKVHGKDMALKEQEILDLRKMYQKAKDQEDATRVEAQRERIKLEAARKSEAEHFQAQIRAKEGLNGAPRAAPTGASFSLGSMVRSFRGERSTKLEAMVQANVTERDHARQLRTLQETLEKLKIQHWKATQEVEQYRDCYAQLSMTNMELKEQVEKYEKLCYKADAKIKKMKVKHQSLVEEKEDLIMKAGWAAEQLQVLTADLEYERSKHVKVSGLQRTKQAEELQKAKEELENLKKNTPLKKEATSASKSKKATSATKKTPSASHETPEKPRTEHLAEVGQQGLLGKETLAELVARKAAQFAEKNSKIDALIADQKREKAEKADPATPFDSLRFSIINRRTVMNEDSVNVSVSSSSEEESEIWKN